MANQEYVQRLTHLQKNLPAQTAWLLTSAYDIAYYTGFKCLVPEERDALLVVMPEYVGLMYATFSPIETPELITRLPGCSPAKVLEHLTGIREHHHLNELWIDPTTLLVSEYHQLEKLGVSMKTGDKKMIWHQRMIKDEQELAAMRTAGRLAEQVMAEVVSSLKMGLSELEVQRQLDVRLRELGAEKEAFPTIVAFGASSALPHHQPTSAVLSKETPVLIDFGVIIDGYRSDMTRTVWFGEQPSQEFKKVEQIIMDAYQAALRRAAVWPMTAADIDLAARQPITNAGYGQQFIHTTGHGIGLDIHEPPSVNWQNKLELKPGVIITIEPGIYLEGLFGYRYENTIELRQAGAVELTKTNK
jgi:Xaa-Pro aminopeptidase